VLLQHSHTHTLTAERELGALSLDQLKASAEEYREHFVRALGLAIQGTIQAPPDQFGETLESEQLKAGSFIEGAGIEDDKWERLMEVSIYYDTVV
jgi:hypothetical protein